MPDQISDPPLDDYRYLMGRATGLIVAASKAFERIGVLADGPGSADVLAAITELHRFAVQIEHEGLQLAQFAVDNQNLQSN